jgi:hypothetical protein
METADIHALQIKTLSWDDWTVKIGTDNDAQEDFYTHLNSNTREIKKICNSFKFNSIS